MQCKRCNADLEMRLSTAAQQLIAKHTAMINVATAAPAAAPVVKAVVADAIVPASRPATAAPAPAAKGTNWLAIGGAIVLAAGAGAGILHLATRNKTPAAPVVAPAAVVATIDKAPPPVPPVVATTTGSNGAAAPVGNSWQANADLPPAWVESKLVIDAESVFIVGEAQAATLERASEAARETGTLRLLDAVAHGLDGSKVSAFLQPRLRRDDSSANTDIAARFVRQFGDVAALERVEIASRNTADGIKAYVRYKLPRAAFDKLIEAYRSTANFRGITVARFFPGLAATVRTGGELIVIDVVPRSAPELAGIRAGDVVLEVGGHPVTSLASFQNISTDAWNNTAARQRLPLRVESAGAARDVQLTKPASVQ